MSYNKMNQSHGLSYDQTLFLSYQKVSNGNIACSYLKEGGWVSYLNGKSSNQ